MTTGSRLLEVRAREHLDCGPSKQRILVAARDLLVERGPMVTLSEIASRAGLDQQPAQPGPLEVFLAQRLDEILELVASVQDPQAATESQPTWLAHLRAALPARLATRTTSLREVSTALAVSPRTLQRRFAEEGTSWRDEVDTARRQLATQLAGAGEARKAIARKVGYSDTRGLRRALRRWNRAEIAQSSNRASSAAASTPNRAKPIRPAGSRRPRTDSRAR